MRLTQAFLTTLKRNGDLRNSAEMMNILKTTNTAADHRIIDNNQLRALVEANPDTTVLQLAEELGVAT